jgi:hypothetical protein
LPLAFCRRVLVTCTNVRGRVEGREQTTAVRRQLLGSDRRLQDDEGRDVLAARRIRHADHMGGRHRGMREQRRLDLGGGHVHAGGLDDVLDAAEEVERTALVEPAEVAGVEEAFAVEALGGLVTVVVRKSVGPRARRSRLPPGRQGTAGLRLTNRTSALRQTGGRGYRAQRERRIHGHAVQRAPSPSP